jgi:LTXXQ motif family protein
MLGVVGGMPYSHAAYALPMKVQAVFDKLDDIRDELRLTAEQQRLWHAAAQQSKTARARVNESARAFIAWSEQELTKTSPDLLELARRLQAMQDQKDGMQRESQRRWLEVYGSLTALQKKRVHDVIRQQVGRFKLFQRLRERFF